MTSTNIKIEQKIQKLYETYFSENDISPDTGKVLNQNLKFASYPFIGTNYGTGKFPKILFVGLDIGKDESPNQILGFSEKRKVIEGLTDNLKRMNPHIAGTFNTVIFCLRNGLLKSEWGKIKHTKSYKDGIRLFNQSNQTNLLSVIGLTNLFKFVTPEREHRTGGVDRRHIFEDKEIKLLLEEIDIFTPDIIVFQSNQFKTNRHYQNLVRELAQKTKCEVIVGSHPSYRGVRNPLAFSRTLAVIKGLKTQ